MGELRKKISEIISQLPRVNYNSDALADTVLLVVREAMPKWEPAHTYASENAEVYRSYDKGFKDCLAKITKQLEN